MSNDLTEAWLEGPESTKFYTRKYARSDKPAAVLVFLHGFAEHIGRYSHFHPRFLEHDLAIFTFDQRGYGKTALDKENKSPESSWTKTSWTQQQLDIEWAIEHVKKAFPSVPVFLMAHSMGGGESLGFATLPKTSPYYDAVKSLSGIVALSPLILQTYPASKALRFIGGKASSLLPWVLIDAPVNPGDLSHVPEVGKAYLADPLVKGKGSLRALNDMLSLGEKLLWPLYENWPKELPLLVCHGNEDKVCSFKASSDFVDKILADKKKHISFEGGYHELPNESEEVQEKLVNTIAEFVEKVLDAKAGGQTKEQADADQLYWAQPQVNQ